MTAPRQTNRLFGISMAIFLSLIAGLVWYFSGNVIGWLIIIASLFLLAALISPSALLPLNRLWANFAGVFGIFTNYIILGSFMLLILFPIKIIMLLLGRDALKIKPIQSNNSHFSPVHRAFDENTMKDLF